MEKTLAEDTTFNLSFSLSCVDALGFGDREVNSDEPRRAQHDEKDEDIGEPRGEERKTEKREEER